MVSVYSVIGLIVSSVCSVTALISGVSLLSGTGVLGDSGFDKCFQSAKWLL